MTRHHKAGKADKKSRNKKATRPETVHHGPSTAAADGACVADGGHQGGKHEGSQHQGGKHQGSQHQGTKHQAGDHQGSKHLGSGHPGGERHTPHPSDQPRDAPSDRHEDRDALAAGDADQWLRRPPRRREAPIGPPLGDHVEATAD
jgi:hypothetical protein